MKRYLFIISWICLILTVAYSQNKFTSKYIFNNITVSEKLPHNFVDDLYKDSHGFMWISTGGGGLVRYDGNEFLTLNVNSSPISLKSNYIRKVCEDNYNRLWVASNMGIDVIDLQTMQKTSFSKEKNKFEVLKGIKAFSILKDGKGAIWLMSVDKIYKINFDQTGEITQINESTSKTGEKPNIFSTIQEIDNIILAGNRGGIYIVSVSQSSSLAFKPMGEKFLFGENTFISSIIKKDNSLWIGTEEGLYKMQMNSNKLEHYTHNETDRNSLSQNMITSLAIIDDGTLVVGTLRGLNFFDAEKNNFNRLHATTGSKSTLSNDFVNCLMTDKNVLWIGTEYGGISKMMLPKLITKNFVHQTDVTNSISPNQVNAIFEDKSGNLWIGTVEGGLNRKIKGTDTFAHYTTGNTNLTHNSVSTIKSDNNENLWIGTWGGGVNIVNTSNLSYPVFSYISFPSQYIGALEYDSINNGMWIGTNRDIYFHNLTTNKTTRPFSPKAFPYIWGTLGSLIDNDSQLYIGTSEGLAIIDLKTYNPETSQFKVLNFNGGKAKITTLFMRNITCIVQRSDHSIWLGSNGYGICKMTKSKGAYTLQFLDKKNGLAHNTVFGLQEDENGLLWISTGHGLSCYNDATRHFANYTCSDGLIGNQFYWNASYKSPSSKNIFFGNQEGLVELIGVNQNSVMSRGKIRFTKLQVLNKTVWYGDNQYLKSDIAYADKVYLHEKDKSFSIEFADLGYDNPSTISYSYRLLGFDDKWINTDADRRFITYTNLQPGKYTFQVRSMSRGNDWSDDTAQLAIIVKPYFYKTAWFNLVLLIAIAWTIYKVYKWRIKELKKQQELLRKKVDQRTYELQKQKKILENQADELIKQNEILDSQNKKIDSQRTQLIQMSAKVQEAMTDRISFFTNITHEFRTPITLIIGPIERALKLSTNPKVIEQLQYVARSSKNLLTLINQLMDFRKVESDKLSIQLRNGDIVSFINDILVPFDSYSSERGIKIRRIYRIDSPEIMFDDEAIRKLIMNLLSNAIKFTPDKGQITFYLCKIKDAKQQDKIYISLKDTGYGINEYELEQIFDRFYQAKNNNKIGLTKSGTGIGLYLCAKIVELLGGNISAKNNRSGGASFRVLLPLIKHSDTPGYTDTLPDIAAADKNENQSADTLLLNSRPTILIVEDNTDMRKYIASILSDRYKILEAENGEKALQLLHSKSVDFIVSDLMMPVMDGMELSKQVKTDFSISHIPFLMLTAKSNVETQISSYKVGVDEFLAKPFDADLLLARIHNMLESRQRFHRNFSINMDLKELNIEEETNDEKFVRKALDIVKANFKNPDYDAADFVDDMGISKSLLNKKMQTLVGQPVVQFIRNYRLTVAHEMILKHKDDLSISEIAFDVGFNDPKYFTRCFTKHFGITPSLAQK